MPDATNQPGQGNTGAGDAKPAESLLGGAPASGGAADQGKQPEAKPDAKPAESLLADVVKEGKQPEAKEAKPEEKKAAIPEKYEFKAPEGVQLDSALIEKATPIFKELGLGQDAAQKLVDFQAAQQVEAAKAFNEQLGKWQAEVKAMPEADKVLGDAKLALNKLADPATQALLAGSWMGSHPGIIKLLASAGKLLREDPLHEGRPDGPTETADPAQAMFGDMITKKS
jgi:hypothetical protein